MTEDTSTPAEPHEETTPEILASQLEKAAEEWESKAEAEIQAADGHLAKEMLYRATADAMRHALHAVKENAVPHEEPPPSPTSGS